MKRKPNDKARWKECLRDLRKECAYYRKLSNNTSVSLYYETYAKYRDRSLGFKNAIDIVRRHMNSTK